MTQNPYGDDDGSEKQTTIKRLEYCFKVSSRCRQNSLSIKGDRLTALPSQ
jgi:hypothetical protein